MRKNKIKILYIIPSLSSGGAERFILDLIKNLDKDIFDPCLLLFKDKGLFYQEALDNNISIKTLKKKFKIDFVNFYNIYKYIKNIKPDIVHTQLGGDVYGKLAAKIAGVSKIVSTEQNVYLNDGIIIRFLKKNTARFSSKLIAISSAVKKDLLLNYNLKKDKVETIFNGVDFKNFLFQDKKANNSGKIVFGSIGRLSEQKNYSLLLKALSHFKGFDFKLMIVGEGELRSDLEREIVNLGLSDKVELLGERRDIASFLSKIDFFVLSSKWEGLGIVLLEAALFKLPVLASNTGGIVDIIKDGERGILFENNNLDSLVEKLKYFFNLDNKKELNVLAENLSNFVIDNFAIEKIAKDYENMYLSLK